jgi:hypothetical protein
VNSYLICTVASGVSIVMLWVFRRCLERCNEAAEAEERGLGMSGGLRYML